MASLQCYECTVDCDDVNNHQIETCDDSEEFCLRLKDGNELTLACAADPPREVSTVNIVKPKSVRNRAGSKSLSLK